MAVFILGGLAALFGLWSTLLTIKLDYDGDPKNAPAFRSQKLILRAVVCLTFVCGVVSAALSHLDKVAADDAASQAQQATRTHQEAAERSLAEIASKLEPFQELARRRHGALGDDAALSALQSDLSQLSSRTTSLETSMSQRTLESAASGRARNILERAKACDLEVIAVMGDQEAAQYAEELRQFFASSGWNTGNGISQGMFGQPIFGARIQGTESMMGTCFNAGMIALREFHPGQRGVVVPQVPSGRLQLVVGSRERR